MKKRKTYRSKQFFEARCADCEKAWFKSNAIGVAARHCDKTGHTVHVDIHSSVTFKMEDI